MNPEEKRKAIERDILLIIKSKLEKGEMSPERASEIAKVVLKTLHPGMSLEEIYRVAPTLDDHFTELSGAVLPIVREYEERVEKTVREHVGRLMKRGKFEEATRLAKDLTEKKIPIIETNTS